METEETTEMMATAMEVVEDALQVLPVDSKVKNVIDRSMTGAVKIMRAKSDKNRADAAMEVDRLIEQFPR